MMLSTIQAWIVASTVTRGTVREPVVKAREYLSAFPPGRHHSHIGENMSITNYNRKLNLALRRVAVLVEKGETEKALRALGFLALRIERGVFVGDAKGFHVVVRGGKA